MRSEVVTATLPCPLTGLRAFQLACRRQCRLNPHTAMKRISSPHERNARDLLVGPWHLLTSHAGSRRPLGRNEALQIDFEHCARQMIGANGWNGNC
jgi:hypothetical protein